MSLRSASLRLALATLAVAAPATALADDYLQLSGVTGGATNVQHKGWIDVSSFQTTTQAASTGAGRGPIGQMTLTVRIDSATPTLMQAAASGRRFASAELDVGGALGATSMIYRMQDVLVSQVSESGGAAGGTPSARVTLSYAAVATEVPSNPDTVNRTLPGGSPTPTVARNPWG